jgi:hypothetical protein
VLWEAASFEKRGHLESVAPSPQRLRYNENYFANEIGMG